MTGLLLAGLLLGDPCVDATAECRRAAQSAILLWRTRSATTTDALVGCRERLDARSEAIRDALAAPAPTPEPTGPSWGAVIGAGGGALVVGAIVGFLLRH